MKLRPGCGHPALQQQGRFFAASVHMGLADVDLGGVAANRIGHELLRRALLPWERGEMQAQASLLRTAPTHPEAAAGVQAVFDQQIMARSDALSPVTPTWRLAPVLW